MLRVLVKRKNVCEKAQIRKREILAATVKVFVGKTFDLAGSNLPRGGSS